MGFLSLRVCLCLNHTDNKCASYKIHANLNLSALFDGELKWLNGSYRSTLIMIFELRESSLLCATTKLPRLSEYSYSLDCLLTLIIGKHIHTQTKQTLRQLGALLLARTYRCSVPPFYQLIKKKKTKTLKQKKRIIRNYHRQNQYQMIEVTLEYSLFRRNALVCSIIISLLCSIGSLSIKKTIENIILIKSWHHLSFSVSKKKDENNNSVERKSSTTPGFVCLHIIGKYFVSSWKLQVHIIKCSLLSMVLQLNFLRQK